MHRCTLWLLGLTSLLGSSVASAAGYYFTDIGVRSFSRGGAFVAGADDLTALYYNPAALTRFKRPQVMLNVAGVQQFVSFQRAQTSGAGPLDDEGNATDIKFGSIENKAPPYVIPHFGLSSRLGTKNTTFAFGFYPPYAPDLAYDKDGPQRYSLIDVMVMQTALGPSVAHQFNDWISVGVGVAWAVLIAEQELKISVPFHGSGVRTEIPDGGGLDDAIIHNDTPANEDPSNDVGFEFAAADWTGLSWNAGVMIEPPTQEWAWGFMVQPPVKFHAEGYMIADFSGHILHTDDYIGDKIILSESVRDNDVALQITMPLILKTGFAVRPSKTSEIELAGVWQNWASIDQLTITDLNLKVDLNGEHSLPQASMDDVVISDDVVLPADYQNAWSVRLGGQQDIGDAFTLRAGTFYEISAIPSSTQSVSLIDGAKIGYGFGGSYRPNKDISIDFGMSQAFLDTVEATDSKVKQISVDALTGEFLEGTTIGNGTYKSSALIFGGGLTWEFGPEA
jgi:long-chain fatty acid transport protein